MVSRKYRGGCRTVTGRLQPLDSSVVAAGNLEERASTEAPVAAGIAYGALEVAAASALGAVIFFFNLCRYGLWEPDEARYAEIAREMISGGSLLVPHLNYVIYVEKPPLLYWLTAFSFHVFGVNEFAARLFVAIFGVIGVAATACFASRAFGKRHALMAGAILATTPLYAVMAQVLTTDMILAALVTIANVALFLHWREGGRWCWIAYLAIALGVLTKGPVAIALPALAMLAFLYWEGDLRGAVSRFRLIGGIALIAAVTAPWFLIMIARVPGYFDFYFIGEHLRRAFEVFVQPRRAVLLLYSGARGGAAAMVDAGAVSDLAQARAKPGAPLLCVVRTDHHGCVLMLQREIDSVRPAGGSSSRSADRRRTYRMRVPSSPCAARLSRRRIRGFWPRAGRYWASWARPRCWSRSSRRVSDRPTRYTCGPRVRGRAEC